MKHLIRILFSTFCFVTLSAAVYSQIIVNGYNPRRYNYSGSKSAISLSYDYHLWVDGNHVPISGSSDSKSDVTLGDPYAREKTNSSTGFSLGFQTAVFERLAVRAVFTTAGMSSGANKRLNLVISEDRSKFTQLGVYGSLSLFKDPSRKLQFQLIGGPELIYAKKHLIIDEYIKDEASNMKTYNYQVSVLEGALVTGLGASYRMTKTISLFTESLVGIAFPGRGFKTTNSLAGLRHSL